MRPQWQSGGSQAEGGDECQGKEGGCWIPGATVGRVPVESARGNTLLIARKRGRGEWEMDEKGPKMLILKSNLKRLFIYNLKTFYL